MSINPLSYYNPIEGEFLKVQKGQLVPYKDTQWAAPIFKEVLTYLNSHTELLNAPFPHREELLSRIHLYSSRKACSRAETTLFKAIYQTEYTAANFKSIVTEQKWLNFQNSKEVVDILMSFHFLDRTSEPVKHDLLKRLLAIDPIKRLMLIHQVRGILHTLPADCEVSFLYLLLPFSSHLFQNFPRITKVIFSIRRGKLDDADVSLLKDLKEYHPKEMDAAMRALPLETWDINKQIDMVPVLPPDKIVSIVRHISPEDANCILDEDHEYDDEPMHIFHFFNHFLQAVNNPEESEEAILDMVQNELPAIYLGKKMLVAHHHPEYLLPYLQDMDEFSLTAIMPFMPPQEVVLKLITEYTPLPRITDLLRKSTDEIKRAIIESLDISSLLREAGSLASLRMINQQLHKLLSAGQSHTLRTLIVIQDRERVKVFKELEHIFILQESVLMKEPKDTLLDVITCEPMTHPVKLPDTEDAFVDASTVKKFPHYTINPHARFKVRSEEHLDAKGRPILEPVRLRFNHERYYVSLETLRTNTTLIAHPINRQLYPPSAFMATTNTSPASNKPLLSSS